MGFPRSKHRGMNRSTDTSTQPRVVILGGGFAGLYAARALRRAPVRLTLVDRRNHHLFQPLLYQVATAALSAPEVAVPIRKILRRQENATVLLGEGHEVDVDARRVRLRDGASLDYDFLIVATGATHAYFGHDEWAEHAPGLKGIGDALEIRQRILCAFESAERESDAEARRRWLTFVIVGAGPTGVELAGALREIAQKTLARDFRNFDPRDTRVLLLDAVDRVLPAFPEELSHEAERLLADRGVEVRTRRKVTAIDELGVTADNERIEARTVLWAAGVRASSIGASLGAPLDRAGRVEVNDDLTVPGHPEVFVVGDLAAVRHDSGWVPGLAPAAIQEGRHAAANVVRTIENQPLRAFRYRDKGLLATIGRAAAVVQIGRFRSAGFFAWLLWLFVHVLWLIGFRNRVVVLFEWAWAYFTYQRSARLIFENTDRRAVGACETASARAASPPAAARSGNR